MRWLGGSLVLAATALLAQGQATFYAAYQDGLDAEQAGRWHEAAAAFRRALALRAQPADRVFTYGNNLLRDYYPRLHLARCLVEMGDLDAAEAQLALARSEPALQKETLERRIREARAQAASTGPARPAQTEPAPLRPASPPERPPAPIQPAAAAPADPRLEPPPRQEAPPPPPGPRNEGAVLDSSPAKPAPPVSPAPRRPAPSSRPEPSGPPPLAHPGLLAGAGGLLALLLALPALRRRRLPWRGQGDSAVPPGSSPVPLMAGPYKLERLLGRGGFADTFLARHHLSGQQVALKLPHPHRTDDPEFRARFRREAQVGAKLDHPNLVRILDPGPEDGIPYLAMEYVPGETLDQRLKACGPLPFVEIVGIARQVAAAMAHAHAHGVVHRDLKPGNIQLTEGGVRVMDLGIARVVDADTVTTTYAFLGTPLYAAPEAQLKSHVGPAADRYSLGVILFQMLAGSPPFQGETPFETLDLHRTAPVPDLRTVRPDAPEALRRLVMRLLDKEPDERPEDSEILRVLLDLDLALSHLPAGLPPD